MIEREIKYNITYDQFLKLKEENFSNVESSSVFERNTILRSNLLQLNTLRIREETELSTGNVTFKLTLKKKRFKDEQEFICREEHELTVDKNPILLLESLGFFTAVVYEKYRETFHISDKQVVCFDRLPFGHYIETENIKIPQFSHLKIEPLSYTELAVMCGNFFCGSYYSTFVLD